MSDIGGRGVEESTAKSSGASGRTYRAIRADEKGRKNPPSTLKYQRSSGAQDKERFSCLVCGRSCDVGSGVALATLAGHVGCEMEFERRTGFEEGPQLTPAMHRGPADRAPRDA